MAKKVPIIEVHSPVMGVWAEDEFKLLTEQEKNYAYYLSQAAWEGAKINFFEKSYESPALFIILQLVFSGQSLSDFKKAVAQEKGPEGYQKFLAYSAAVFNNCGNFKSFGDSKFVPDLSPDDFSDIIQLSNNYEQNKKLIDYLYAEIRPFIFSYEGRHEKIGLPPFEGSTGYYSSNLSKVEIDQVDEFLKIHNLETLNTRIVKQGDKHYQVLIASVNVSNKTHYFRDNRIDIVYGDFSPFLRRVVQSLQKGLSYAANHNQRTMLKRYIDHFITGDIELHKDSQRAWVQDKGPVVESNIGFIESYLDPKNVRAEWEGFTACVNKKQSEVTNHFVSKAPEFLSLLPWPKEFEKDTFLKPDFTSLAVLAFSGSGTPLGINIPNYEDIRQEEGFKNVYLGNCVPKPKKSTILFLNEEDAEQQIKWFPQHIFHKIVFHELLGHGCGKLFYKTENGFNFDPKKTIDPTTKKPVTSFYKENETWLSVFTDLSQAYEECRADAVALYFSCFEKSYEVLQPEYAQDWLKICEASFIDFIYAGITGLQFYNPEANKWGQAHINGRWVILQVLLEAENGFVSVEKVSKDGKDTIEVNFDRGQVLSTGLDALKEFLLKLQVFKSTADIERGRAFFGKYSQVNEKFLEIRRIVIENQRPRRLEVQGHLRRDEEGNFAYQKFEEDFEGIISSYIERFPYFDQDVYDLWKENARVFKPVI